MIAYVQNTIGSQVNDNSGHVISSTENRKRDEDVKSLRSFITRFKKTRRQPTLLIDRRWRVFYKIFLLTSLVNISFDLFDIFFNLSSGNITKVNWDSFIGLALFSLTAVFSFLKLSNGPEDKGKLDEWLWRKGRLMYGIYAVCFIMLVPYALSIEWRLIERHFSIILSTVSAISYLIYIFILFAIVSRPVLILSGVLTGFASISVLNGFISGISLIFMPKKIHTGFNFEAFTAIALPLLSSFIYIFFFYKRTRLNIAQRSVVKIIHPKRLLFALESAVEDIKITIRALSIIDDHEGKEEFQLLNALAQEITRRYTVHRIHHKKKILYLIVTTIWIIIAATIAAIWEGLSQAAFLDIVKQFICNKIGICLK